VKLGHVDQAIQLAQVELLPIVSVISGFVAYQAITVGPQSIVSVSTYRVIEKQPTRPTAPQHSRPYCRVLMHP
jgi:hypothetical protein